MSGIAFLSEWQDPAFVRREIARVRDAAGKNVHYGMSGDQKLLLDEAWRIACALVQAWPGEWVEMRMEEPRVRFDEGMAYPVTLLAAAVEEKEALHKQLAKAQGHVVIWREAGVPEWSGKLTLPKTAVGGWIGNDKHMEPLGHGV